MPAGTLRSGRTPGKTSRSRNHARFVAENARRGWRPFRPFRVRRSTGLQRGARTPGRYLRWIVSWSSRKSSSSSSSPAKSCTRSQGNSRRKLFTRRWLISTERPPSPDPTSTRASDPRWKRTKLSNSSRNLRFAVSRGSPPRTAIRRALPLREGSRRPESPERPSGPSVPARNS